MEKTVAAFKPALPPAVREVVDAAEQHAGPAHVWLAGMSPLQLSECLRMLNEIRVSSEVLGWLVGMTMFACDPHQQLASALGRKSFRDDVIPHVLDAFGAGIVVAQQTAGPRLWTSIEMLAGRVEAARVPPRLLEALPAGLCSPQAVSRGCAMRIALELGAPARAVIEARAKAVPNRALDDALIALAGGDAPPPSADHAELLQQLLVEWRATHDPELEPAIARIGGDLARARGTIEARSYGELEGAWHAVAAKTDPVDVTRLVDLRFPATWKRALDRVDALARFAPDPRIATRLAEIARNYTSNASRPLHLAIASVIADMPTPSVAAALDAIPAGLEGAYARARASLATLAVRAADRELVARSSVGGAERGHVDALLAQHAANPGDLDARMVLADALQAAGDPRGELITLQLAIADGTASAGAARRVASLLDTHGDAWTGPLPGVERSNRRFERGFLIALETSASNAAIARTLDRPEWRTIEELSLRAEDIELAPLIEKLPLLRRLCAPARSLERLANPVPRLRAIFSRGAWLPQPGQFPELAVLGGMWFPATTNEGFRRLQRALANLRGLHAVVHNAFPASSLATAIIDRQIGPPETRFTLARLRSGFDPLGWRVRIRRDDPRVDVAWTYHRWGDNVIPEVFQPLLTAGITRVALHMPEMLRVHRDRLIAERPFGIEVVPGEPIDLVAPS